MTTPIYDTLHYERPRVLAHPKPSQKRATLADMDQFEAAMAELATSLADVTTTHTETDRILADLRPSRWSRFRAWVKEQMS